MYFIEFDKTGHLISRYTKAIHGNGIPASAIEVDENTFYRTINEQDGEWRLDQDKATIKKHSLPGPTESELSASVRAQRDALLRESDWVALRSLETERPVPADWSVYRRSLRDIPQQDGFPNVIDWPEKPEFMPAA